MEVKEAPTRGLRAVFAGFSRALGGRRKDTAAPAATAKAPAGGKGGHVKVLDTEETAVPETAAALETVAPQTATPVAATPVAATPVAAPQAAAAETAAPVAEASDDLPLANYDTLTVASLRARDVRASHRQDRGRRDYELPSRQLAPPPRPWRRPGSTTVCRRDVM
jgi:hypothetical protein